nr:hypothetical protein [Tanacetum cinerariifolium]
QDSLNAAAGSNLLEKSTQDVLTIIENKSKQTSVVTTAIADMLKQFQATPPLASIKAVEETFVTCGGAHPYYQCLAAGGNTVPEFRDNIQGYVSAAAVNYNQDTMADQRTMAELLCAPTEGYAEAIVVPLILAEQFEFKHSLINMMTSDHDSNSPSSSEIAKLTHAVNQQTSVVTTAMTAILKQFQATPPPASVKAITTRSGIVFDGPSVPIPPPFINPAKDEHVEETLTDHDLAKYTIKVPHPLV